MSIQWLKNLSRDTVCLSNYFNALKPDEVQVLQNMADAVWDGKKELDPDAPLEAREIDVVQSDLAIFAYQEPFYNIGKRLSMAAQVLQALQENKGPNAEDLKWLLNFRSDIEEAEKSTAGRPLYDQFKPEYSPETMKVFYIGLLEEASQIVKNIKAVKPDLVAPTPPPSKPEPTPESIPVVLPPLIKIEPSSASAEVLTEAELEELKSKTYQIDLDGKHESGEYLTDRSKRHFVDSAFLAVGDALKGTKRNLQRARGSYGSLFSNWESDKDNDRALGQYQYYFFEPFISDYDRQAKREIIDESFQVLRFYIFREGSRMMDHRVRAHEYESNLISVLLDNDSATELQERVRSNPENAHAFLRYIAPGLTEMNIQPAKGLCEFNPSAQLDIGEINQGMLEEYALPFLDGSVQFGGVRILKI